MKVPGCFSLLGTVWTVKRTADITEYGRCDEETSTIWLRSGMESQTELATFAHELVHAIKFTMGETDHSEKEVSMLGGLIHQFLVTAR